MRPSFLTINQCCSTTALIGAVVWGIGFNTAFAQTPTPRPPVFDLTDNGVVNDADAWMVAEAWSDLGETGDCLSAQYAQRDVDQSGCVDVADVQAVLGRWGQFTTPNAGRPRSTPNDVGRTFVVTNTAADKDANPGDGVCATSSGVCTFRAAVDESNRVPGTDTIAFDVRKSDGSCPTSPTVFRSSGTVDEFYITTTALILDDQAKAGTIIDGYTQCNAVANSEPIAGNAKIKIELDGANTTGNVGVFIVSPNNIVRGLALYDHDDNILLNGGAATDNRIEGNFIGTNSANTFSGKGTGTTDNQGIRLRSHADRNVIGGATPAQRNIISGSAGDGLYMEERANDNRVIGNYVGLRQDGITKLGNNSDAMDINIGCQNNIIGGTEPGERNVISGNTEDGIEFSHTRPPNRVTSNLKVIGNYVGVSAYGGKIKDSSGNVLPVGNGEQGLTLEDQVTDYEAFNNVIANNGSNGVRLYFRVMRANIHHNLIGVGPSGEPLPNGVGETEDARLRGNNGVLMLADAQDNTIQYNVIAYNKGDGIKVSNSRHETQGGEKMTDYNTISRNSIFANVGRGIFLDPSGSDYPNLGIKAPTIGQANTAIVFGTTYNATTQTACPGCTVEVFVSDQTSDNEQKESAGEGKTFVGAGVTDAAGVYAITVSGVVVGDKLTATLTDPQGNTSMFAKNVTAVQGPAPTATPVPGEPTVTPTATPGPGQPTATPVPGQPTATPGPGQPTATPVPGQPAPTQTVGPAPGQNLRLYVPIAAR